MTDLVNEMIDNYKLTEQIVKRSNESGLVTEVQKNRISLDGVVSDLFKEIGREQAVMHIKNEIRGGRRASLLVRQN